MLEINFDDMSDTQLYEKIHSLVHTKTPESIYLIIKKNYISKLIKEKIELAKDISSFANTQGGCLIYGIDEETD